MKSLPSAGRIIGLLIYVIAFVVVMTMYFKGFLSGSKLAAVWLFMILLSKAVPQD